MRLRVPRRRAVVALLSLAAFTLAACAIWPPPNAAYGGCVTYGAYGYEGPWWEFRSRRREEPRGRSRATGRVVDERGVPVAGVPVSGEVVVPTNARPQRAYREAVTDPGGRFAFDDLPTGELRMTPFFSVANMSRNNSFCADLPGAPDHEFTIPGHLELAGRIEGLLALRTTVCLVEAGFFGGEELLGYERRHAVVSPTGSFRFTALEPGRYRLYTADGWSFRKGPLMGLYRSRRDARFELASFDVVRGEPDDEKLRVHLRVVLPDDVERAVGSLTATGLAEDAPPRRSQLFTATRGQRGPSTYSRSAPHPSISCSITRVLARAPGLEDTLAFRSHPGPHRFLVEAEGFEPVEVELDIACPDELIEVELTRKPGRAVSASIDAKVWTVDARRPGEAEWTPLLEYQRRVAWLAPGRWELRVASTEEAELLHTVEIDDGPKLLVLELALAPGATLRGQVVRPDGAPFGGTVPLHVLRREHGDWVDWPIKSQELSTKGESRFEIAGLNPGRYRLALDTEGRFLLGEVELGEMDRDVELVAWD